MKLRNRSEHVLPIVILLSGATLASGGCGTGNSLLFDRSPSVAAQAPAPEARADSTETDGTVAAAQDPGVHEDDQTVAAGDDMDPVDEAVQSYPAARPVTRFHEAADAGPDIDPQASLIGLYGELVNDSPAAAGQLDGAGNITQVSFASEGSVFNPDVDRSGERIVFASTQHRQTADIYVKSPRGSTLTQLTSDPANDMMPTFSPDAEHIAFASDRSGSWDIYLMSSQGGQATQITRDPDAELHPSFSPDGRLLAYCKMGSRSGRWEIWVIDLEHATTSQFLDYGLFPQWSPDVTSGKILFQRARERGSRFHSVWTIDFVNGERRRPTEIVSAANAAIINPSWSPDGRKIVFVTDVNPEQTTGARPDQADVWVINADGTGRTAMTNGQFANYEPVWAPNGTIYFISDRSGVDNIWAKVPESGLDGFNANRTNVVNVDPAQQQPGDQP